MAVLTLNNPPVNVLEARVLNELGRQLDSATDDLGARVILLRSGIERAFAAGASIREMATMGPAEAERHGALGQSITRQIEGCPLPVIAAVQGVCVGGGSEVAEACDFVLASEDAVFGQPEINLGVMPGWGGTQRLPRRIGSRAARAWVLLGRNVDAHQAMAQGLVWKVVPRPELLPEAMALAQELAQKPALALAAAKYALNAAIDRGETKGLAYERRLWSRLFGTPGQREGMQAFLEKRPAAVIGRGDWGLESRGFPWASRSSRPARAPGTRPTRRRDRKPKR